MTWVSRLGPRYPKGPYSIDGFMQAATWPPMGLIPYGPTATARDFFPLPPAGPWASNWANTDVYPADIESWPGHERWFDHRLGIASCEFTIYQTILPTALVYGSLLEKPPPMPESDGGVPSDGGILDGGDSGGTTMPGGGDEGCGCRLTGAPPPTRLLWVLVLAGLVVCRARQGAPRA